MHDVATSAVASLVRAANRAGIDAQPAMMAAGIAESALDEPGDRIAWSAFLEFIETLETTSAKPARFEAIVHEMAVGSSGLAQAIALFDSPIDFYRFAATLYLPAYLRPLRVGFEAGAKGDGDYRLIVEIGTPHRSSPSLLRMVGAIFKSLPTLFGFEAAEVKSDVHERGAAFSVRDSTRRPKTKTKRAARELVAEDARALVETTFEHTIRTSRELEVALEAQRDGDERLARVREFSGALGRSQDLNELGNLLADLLRAPPYVCGSVSLSLVDHGAEHPIVRAGEMTPGAVVRTQPLRLGEREIARLETSGFLSQRRPDALDDIAPLLGVAIDRLIVAKSLRDQILSSRPPEDGPSEDVLHRRLARSAGEWQLTPRQLACVERLVRGRSNREIARDIGCTERTVEAHLAVVFRRAGVRARSSLVARFWSEAW